MSPENGFPICRISGVCVAAWFANLLATEVALSTGRGQDLVVNQVVSFLVRGELGMAVATILCQFNSPLVNLLEMPETFPLFTE